MRDHGEDAERVTSIELFFDLVFVFAVTQLARLLVDHLSALGAAQTLLLLLAVWRAWIDMAWITNWFDPNRSPVRLLLLGVMLLSLIMSAALPEAFGARGLAFAGAFVAIQITKPTFAVAALGSQPQLRLNFQRILVWCLASAVLWLAGGFAQGTAREILWLAAVLVDYAAPASGFFTPGLGRSHTTDWTIAGSHMAERCQLFLIIALGESILDTGVGFSALAWSGVRIMALVVAFAGTVALWWIYFYRSAEGGSRVISTSTDPGRLGRSAYTYFHLPMVAGIIVTAVGDELTVAHPTGSSSMATTMVILGGAALFLAGHALFKRALSGRIYASRLVGIDALAALVPGRMMTSPLLLAAGATLILMAVAGWETWVGWRAGRSKEEAAEAAPTAVGS
jgi:low temperature requirement protein LtrA